MNECYDFLLTGTYQVNSDDDDYRSLGTSHVSALFHLLTRITHLILTVNLWENSIPIVQRRKLRLKRGWLSWAQWVHNGARPRFKPRVSAVWTTMLDRQAPHKAWLPGKRKGRRGSGSGLHAEWPHLGKAKLRWASILALPLPNCELKKVIKLPWASVSYFVKCVQP